MIKYILSLMLSLAGLLLMAQPAAEVIRVSDDITLRKLTNKTYLHVSVTEIEGFGKVASNGLLLIGDGEAFLFDTPVTNEQTETLVTWVADSLHAKVTTFVPNHWHNDCMGGLEYLHSIGVDSYAHQMTIDIAKEKGLPVPHNGFSHYTWLKLHDVDILCHYPGAAHAMDNIVVWIPSEGVMFAGCMAKDINSKGLGNVVDGSREMWPQSIRNLIEIFPQAEIIVPGHGEPGNRDLLYHTLRLLSE